MTDNKGSFKKTQDVDSAGIVGAEWWQSSMAEAHDAAPRREALRRMMFFGGTVTPVGAALLACKPGSDSGSAKKWKQEERKSLEAQRKFGWSFGSPNSRLIFQGETNKRSDGTNISPVSMPALQTALAPSGKFKPFYSSALFQAPSAMPTKKIKGDSPATALSREMRAVSTASTKKAYHQGAGLARAFAKKTDGLMLIVDMPGPEAVAFAAGAAELFEPVFYFDNWPHPKGVVAAHQTLGSALYYEPRFAKAKGKRKAGAPGAIVLDRKRLARYVDGRTQFDNRYLALIPTAANLKSMGVKRVLYVTPSATERLELDDLNDDFVDFEKQKIDVRMIAATDFRPASDTKAFEKEKDQLQAAGEWPPYTYGGESESYDDFWVDYGGADGGGEPNSKAKGVTRGGAYRAANRTTMFSGTGTTKTSTGRGFGRTAVAGRGGRGHRAPLRRAQPIDAIDGRSRPQRLVRSRFTRRRLIPLGVVYRLLDVRHRGGGADRAHRSVR